MSPEGHPETAEEIQAVITSEGFRWHDERLRQARRERDTARVTGLLEAVRRRHGPLLAQRLAGWHQEE